jgi:hypothetical protein
MSLLSKSLFYLKGCINLKFTLFFFIITNVLSFISIWKSIPAGLIFSIISIIFLVLYSKSLILILLNKKSILFLMFLFIQLFSFFHFLINDYSREIIFSNPSLLVQGFSYILIPQVLFYFLGFSDIRKKSSDVGMNFKLISILFLVVFSYGIFLHFFRPSYFVNFQNRIFLSDPNTGYLDFYPKFTIYWNSMIVGVLSVSLFWTSMLVPHKRITIKILSGFIFFIAIIFSTQRGAWAALLISFLTFLIFFFNIRLFVKYLLSLIFLGLALLYIINFISMDFDTPLFIDLINRFTAFDNAFSERSSQFENFLFLIKKYPFGVGLGLLTHKASDLNLLLTTPDGNYYRIFGELGVIGFLSFIFMLTSSIYISYKRNLRLFFIVLIVYASQSFGTNVFDLYAASFFFWYILGQVNGSESNVKYNL